MCVFLVPLSHYYTFFGFSCSFILMLSELSEYLCLIHSFPFLTNLSLIHYYVIQCIPTLLLSTAIRVVHRFFIGKCLSFTTSKCPLPNAHMHIHKCTFAKALNSSSRPLASSTLLLLASLESRPKPPFLMLLNIYPTQILEVTYFFEPSSSYCCCFAPALRLVIETFSTRLYSKLS